MEEKNENLKNSTGTLTDVSEPTSSQQNISNGSLNADSPEAGAIEASEVSAQEDLNTEESPSPKCETSVSRGSDAQRVLEALASLQGSFNARNEDDRRGDP